MAPKTRFALFFLLLPFLSFTAAAQSDSLQIARTYRNELGADFLPIITGGNSGGIMLRRHQEKAAWRSRLYGNFRQSYQDADGEFYRQGAITVRVGREWHHDLNKLRFYYGIDLGGSYNSLHHSVQQPAWFEDHDRTLQGGLLPVLGFGYKIKERFMVSAEANGWLAGGRTWRWSRGRSGREFSYISFNPVSEFALFLSYRF